MSPFNNQPETIHFDADGIEVVGDLYVPEGDGPRPAVVVAGSLTSVKEMMGGRYARELAKRGVMALAIDYRNFGQSAGEPRQYDDYDTKTTDLTAAASYLLSRDDVAQDQVGLLGICTSGGNVLYAAAQDSRIRAVATVVGWFAEPSLTPDLYGGEEGVAKRMVAAREARHAYEESGENWLIPAYHNTDQTASHVGPMEYYMDPHRGGGIVTWTNAFAVMSWAPWLAFDPVGQAAHVAAPTLIVHSEQAALPDQARKVYDRLAGPKDIAWVEGQHFDFYDQEPNVTQAADIVSAFLCDHLDGRSH